jgi:hypothetical protein
MRLVYLYGPPGVGKLTVARELVALTGFKLFHNHLSVNLAASLFPYRSDPYTRLLRQVRKAAFTEAVRAGVDLVFTSVYNGSADQLATIRTYLEPIYEGSGKVELVRLTCERDVWLARVQDEARQDEAKLTDPDRALALFKGRDPFAVLPLGPTLTLDTTHLPPRDAAARIAAHYHLPISAEIPSGARDDRPRTCSPGLC